MKKRLAAGLAAGVALIVAAVTMTQAQDSLERGPLVPGPGAPLSAGDLALVAEVAGRTSQFDYLSRSDDLTNLLPNVRYRYPDGTVRPMSDLVVRGQVLRIDPGPGWRNRSEKEIAAARGDSDIRQVAFEDPEADFRHAHLVVRVLEEIGASEPPAPAELRIGVTLHRSPDLAALTRGFQAAESYVFFLHRGSQLYAYDPSLYAIAYSTQALTEVDENDRLSLPGLEHKEAEGVLRRASTLDELKAAAARPTRTREAPKPRGLA